MSILNLTNTQKGFLRKGMVFSLALFLLIAPFVVFAALDPLVPCDGPKSVAGSDARTCNFQAFLRGINSIINWMFVVAVPLSLVSFAYAGIMIMTGVEGNISTGKEVFTSVIKGVVIMAVAWLLIHTIVRGLLNPQGGFESYLFGL